MTDLFSYLEEEAENNKNSVKEEKIYSVHQITLKIKSELERGFRDIRVEGEISNYKKHSSGHMYFSLKDERAVISCVIWRSKAAKLGFEPEAGQKVKVMGNISLYEAGGRYQIDVKKMQISGVGELQAMFEALKRKLNKEGLFDPLCKKSIPYYSKNVGVVTAETGAAFQDIKKVIKARAPYMNIFLYNSRVQGKGAENEIAAGIEHFNSEPDPVDVLIIGRGGGSLEDLWPFNEEVVARAVYGSKIPVISAVGHEIDFSISDFAADIRAATPSHAAELVSLSVKDELYRINQYQTRLYNMILSYFIYQKEIIKGIENSYAFKRPADIIKNYYMVLDNIEDNFNFYFERRIENEKVRIGNFENMFRSLNPRSVLNRGYAIVRDKKTGSIIPDAVKIKKEQDLELELRDGKVNVSSD
ncbi:MAG: exodeoxyribonuclease VII large subunit [Candidatus Delongbacteria bacterium]